MKPSILRILIVFVLLVFSTSSKAQYYISTPAIYTTSATCTGSNDFWIYTSGYTSGLSVQCYFGDGTDSTYTIVGGGYAFFTHTYPASGTYSIKLVLYLGTSAIDSNIFSYYSRTCSYLPIGIYLDNNGNCIFDTLTDSRLYLPAKIAVDSAGIPIDTFSCLFRHGYKAFGPPGTVYTFRLVSCPSGFYMTCPTTGYIYDTVRPAGISVTSKNFSLDCNTSSVFDLGLNTSMNVSIRRGGRSKCFVTNTDCTPTASTLTITHSPKIAFNRILPVLPYTISGNTVTINTGLISAKTAVLLTVYWDTVGTPVLGDTINTTFSVTPTSGDSDVLNNVVVRCDTIRMSYDPNYKSVTPSGDITPGTLLEYMVQFENTGNDTAINIHIMDTLSNNVDANTLNILTSSHAVTMIPYSSGGYNIVKFDFPNINLPDSSHHDLCHGFVTYTVRAKSTMTPGMAVHNAAGIYFDINPVVMTNTTESKIPFPVNISSVAPTRIELYPNPVKDVLNIKTEGSDNTMTVTNALGQLVMTQHLNSNNNTINVRSLTPGLYYMTVKGAGSVKVQKFEKM